MGYRDAGLGAGKINLASSFIAQFIIYYLLLLKCRSTVIYTSIMYVSITVCVPVHVIGLSKIMFFRRYNIIYYMNRPI